MSTGEWVDPLRAQAALREGTDGFVPVRPCEADLAIAYLKVGPAGRVPLEEPISTCSGERQRVVFFQPPGTPQVAELSWRAYEVCRAHHRQILREIEAPSARSAEMPGAVP